VRECLDAGNQGGVKSEAQRRFHMRECGMEGVRPLGERHVEVHSAARMHDNTGLVRRRASEHGRG
jgi:hypothetical protein